MRKWIKIVITIILVLLVLGSFLLWKKYSYEIELRLLLLMGNDKLYFQEQIDNFYRENLRYPNSKEFKNITSRFFDINDCVFSELIKDIQFNDELVASICSNEKNDTNNIGFFDYLIGNHCIVFQYDKELKGIYSKRSLYLNQVLLEDEKLYNDLKKYFREIQKLYMYNIVDCDTSKKVYIEIGAPNYYTLIKGVKVNEEFIFSFEYSEYDKIDSQNFYIEELNKRISSFDLLKDNVDLIYIPFSFIKPENYECKILTKK